MKVLGKRLSKYNDAYDKIEAGDIIAFHYTQKETYKNPTDKPLIGYYRVKKKEYGGLLIKYIYGDKGLVSGGDEDWEWVRLGYTEGYVHKLSQDDEKKLLLEKL
jgi:hypothetical protein